MTEPVADEGPAWARPARELFGIRWPIVQGPMSGGPSTPELVAAVSNAGGLGSLGGGYLSPEQLRADIRAVRAATGAPFAVNLFAPGDADPDPDAIGRAVDALAPYYAELGLSPPEVPASFAPSFDEQVAVVVAEAVPVFSVTFGPPPAGVVAALHEVGTLVGGTATTVPEAVALHAAGVDFVCAQGSESGGHRGSFLSSADDLIGLVALTPRVRDAVPLPVVAAGGIADGRGVAAALALGASAVQLGTAFLLTPEAGTSAPYRDALRGAAGEDTVITRAFSGRRARGIRNRLADDLAGRTDLPGYPVLNALTAPLRRHAAAAGRADVLSLWAGQAVSMTREVPAGELVDRLVAETAAAVTRLTGSGR